ncbi:GNAT family protein [Streptomyces triculaminicus]|uniref:GNAT family N-acetyltransferase n=1 Tax=Streptomyces triculaminicus TaxID=2816232 RepID=UPI0033FBA118
MTSFWAGKRVRLRGIEPDDWTAFMRFAADEERLGDLLRPPRSAEGYRAWAKEQATAISDGDCFPFMFAERRYHKCQARIFAHNEASLALQRRLGFIEEGRLRDHVFFAGRHHDLVMMGMLAEEFARLHSMSEM